MGYDKNEVETPAEVALEKYIESGDTSPSNSISEQRYDDVSFDPPFPDAEEIRADVAAENLIDYDQNLAEEECGAHEGGGEDMECTCDEPEDGGYKYATYDGPEPSADVPASLNEDGELPPYSIYARYWPTPNESKDRKPLHYQKLACGHKLRGDGFEPNHRNCERCWFTFFQVNGEFTKSVVEAHQAGGDELIIKLKGKTFLHNFKKFMSTVALIQAQQEAANKAKENDESIAGSGGVVASTEGEEGHNTSRFDPLTD